ncbi:MAG: aspartate/glutamate racemase family protein [Anaerovorax sp.]|nr:aspartate/glutamate racemase family protein [Anaerovorax sp.]
MKILFIRPIITNREDYLEEDIIREFATPDTEIIARHLKFGPSSIENEYDLCHSAPFVVEQAIKAEKDGFDGVISYCFANPGVDACREAIKIPVLGSGEASLSIALAVGRRIGIVTILPNILPLIRKQCAPYINIGKIVAVRSADIPVLSINNNLDVILEKLYLEAKKCITQNDADTIVLGCTGFAGFAKRIQHRLEKEGYFVPVLDPAATSIRMMEALIACNVTNNKITYMQPIEKEMKLPTK